MGVSRYLWGKCDWERDHINKTVKVQIGRTNTSKRGSKSMLESQNHTNVTAKGQRAIQETENVHQDNGQSTVWCFLSKR